MRFEKYITYEPFMYKQLIYKALSKAEKTRDVFDKLIFKSVTVLVLVETMKIYIPSSVEVIQD